MRPLSWLAAALAVAGGLAHAADGPVLGGNVEHLLAFARERHPEILARRHEVAAAQERIESAGALPDPMFGIELSNVTDVYNDNTGGRIELLPPRIRGEARFTATQTLPWFGKRDLRRSVAAAEHDAATQSVAVTWADLAWQIKQTFAEHYLHATSLRYGRQNLAEFDHLIRIAEARYASGLAPKQDAIRAQTERTALAGELAMIEAESAGSAARMRSLLGQPPDFPLRPPVGLREAPRHLDRGALEARLLAANPRLAADAARIDSARKNRDLAWRERYPDVNVGLSAMQQENKPTRYDLMFEMNIPLQQSARRAREREAERMIEAARARQEATRVDALATLSQNVAAWQAAGRVETLVANSLIPQAELGLQAALAGYETGRVDFAAVLDAQRQVRQAREARVRARVEQDMRRADIERALGEEL